MQQQAAIKIIGKYSYYVSQCLGQGSFGKVYQGYENSTKEKVAIKKIDFKMFEKDSYLEQSIYSEIKILNKFRHPHIVQLFQVLNSKRSLYIIMEYCKNGDLKKYIKQRGKVSESEAFAVLKQIASGFKELMKEKVIHRDLKPANILINNNTFKICDFGFSKYVDNVQDVLKSCVGSPIYMAPQILDKQKYNYKCDIWSFGIIYYQMIHGFVPWKGMNEVDLLKNIKNIPLKFNQCSQRVQRFIRSCLTHVEEKRVSWQDVFSYFQLNISNQMSVVQQTNKQKLVFDQSTSLVKPKFLNRYFFQQLAFRHFVCVDIRSKLHRLRRLGFSKHIFQKLIILVSCSIKWKYEVTKGDIQRIHQTDLISKLKQQFKFYNDFLTQFLDQINRQIILNEIKKDQEYRRLLENNIADEARQKYQSLVKSLSNTILDEIMEQIKMTEQNKQKQLMFGLMDNICDMVLINENYTKHGQIPFSRIFKQKSDEVDMTKSLNKISNKSSILRKSSKFTTSFFN